MRGFSTGTLGEPLLNPSQSKSFTRESSGLGYQWARRFRRVDAGRRERVELRGGERRRDACDALPGFRSAARGSSMCSGFATLTGPTKLKTSRSRSRRMARRFFVTSLAAKDIVDPHDEVSLYWGWAFTWDSAAATLKKGPARLSIQIEKATAARRHVDCFLLTNDPAFKPSGRAKPDFAASALPAHLGHRSEAARFTTQSAI